MTTSVCKCLISSIYRATSSAAPNRLVSTKFESTFQCVNSLSSFRCKVGGEWKALDSFSASQQKLIQMHVRTRGTVDAANSGMVCLEHSAQWKGELRCDLCGLIKPADHFSKSSRKSDDPVGLPKLPFLKSMARLTGAYRCAFDALHGQKLRNLASPLFLWRQVISQLKKRIRKSGQQNLKRVPTSSLTIFSHRYIECDSDMLV